MRSNVHWSVSLISSVATLIALAACECGPTPADAHGFKWEREAIRDSVTELIVVPVSAVTRADASTPFTFVKDSGSAGGLKGELSIEISKEVTRQIDWKLSDLSESFDNGESSRTYIVTDPSPAGSDASTGLPAEAMAIKPKEPTGRMATQPATFIDHPVQVQWSVVVLGKPSQVVSAGSQVVNSNSSQAVVAMSVSGDALRAVCRDGVAPEMSTIVTVKEVGSQDAKALLSLTRDGVPSNQLSAASVQDYDRQHPLPPEYAVKATVSGGVALRNGVFDIGRISVVVTDRDKPLKAPVDVSLEWKLVRATKGASVAWPADDQEVIDRKSVVGKAGKGSPFVHMVSVSRESRKELSVENARGSKADFYLVGRAFITGQDKIDSIFSVPVESKQLVPEYSLAVNAVAWKDQDGTLSFPVSVKVQDHGKSTMQPVSVMVEWRLVSVPQGQKPTWDSHPTGEQVVKESSVTQTIDDVKEILIDLDATLRSSAAADKELKGRQSKQNEFFLVGQVSSADRLIVLPPQAFTFGPITPTQLNTPGGDGSSGESVSDAPAGN